MREETDVGQGDVDPALVGEEGFRTDDELAAMQSRLG
jgi:hypothetical protein